MNAREIKSDAETVILSPFVWELYVAACARQFVVYERGIRLVAITSVHSRLWKVKMTIG
jgi:hypothetical protein